MAKSTSLIHVQLPVDNNRVLHLLTELVEAVRLQPDRTVKVNEAYHEAVDYLAKKEISEKTHV